MIELTAADILNEYQIRGVEFPDEEFLREDEQWLAECARCSVCDTILLHDDEAYYDDELEQALCPKHSVFDESEDMYHRCQDEDFHIKYNSLSEFSFKQVDEFAVKLFHNGQYVTCLETYDECDAVYDELEEDDVVKGDLQYILINHGIVKLYDIKELT